MARPTPQHPAHNLHDRRLIAAPEPKSENCANTILQEKVPGKSPPPDRRRLKTRAPRSQSQSAALSKPERRRSSPTPSACPKRPTGHVQVPPTPNKRLTIHPAAPNTSNFTSPSLIPTNLHISVADASATRPNISPVIGRRNMLTSSTCLWYNPLTSFFHNRTFPVRTKVLHMLSTEAKGAYRARVH